MIPFYRLDTTDRDAMINNLTNLDADEVAVRYLERLSWEEITLLQAGIDMLTKLSPAVEAHISNLAENTHYIPDDLRKVALGILEHKRNEVEEDIPPEEYKSPEAEDLRILRDNLNALLEHLK